MRLTKKGLDIRKTSRRISSTEFCDIYDKLSKLEDIEERNGIDTIILFKALENGIWTKDGKFIDGEDVTLGWHVEDNEYEAVANDITYYHTLYLCLCDEFMAEDYGKTWALTREELSCLMKKR